MALVSAFSRVQTCNFQYYRSDFTCGSSLACLMLSLCAILLFFYFQSGGKCYPVYTNVYHAAHDSFQAPGFFSISTNSSLKVDIFI